MTAPLDRARALLARAVHPETPEHEARTSAMLLARLLAGGAVVIAAPGFADASNDAAAVRDNAARWAGKHTRRGKPWRPPEPDVAGWPPLGGVFIASSHYAGVCNACRGFYQVGDPIWWMPGSGARHERCGKFPE